MEECLMSNHRGPWGNFYFIVFVQKTGPFRLFESWARALSRRKLFMVLGRPDDTFNLLMRGARCVFSGIFEEGTLVSGALRFHLRKTKRIRVIISQNLWKIRWIGADEDEITTDRWWCLVGQRRVGGGRVVGVNKESLGPYTVQLITNRRRRMKFEWTLITRLPFDVK